MYLAGQAQLHADTRTARSHQPYRTHHDRLVDLVITHLRRGWTPEEISGRLPIEFPSDWRMRASPETLSAWIYSPEQHRKLWEYLVRGQKKRRRIKGRSVHTERIKHHVSIHDRPAVIESREEFGHWESDNVLRARGTGEAHTTVERVSKFYMAIKIPEIAAQPTLDAQLGFYRQLPAHAVKSITVDNGSEFAHHHRLADTIGVPTYFADPYCAYQRRSNAHFNGRLRRYIP